MNTACWVLRHNIKWREAQYNQLWTPESLIRRSLTRSGNLLFAEASSGGGCSLRLGHNHSYRTHFRYFTRTIKTSSQRTIHQQNCFIWLSTWTHRKNYHLSVLVILLGCVRGVCNFLGSVSPQQKFEAMDRPLLQLGDTAWFHLASKRKPSLKREGGPIQKKWTEEKRIQKLLFLYCFSSSPWTCPM